MYRLVKFCGSFYLWKYPRFGRSESTKSVLVYSDTCGKTARSVFRSLRKAYNV